MNLALGNKGDSYWANLIDFLEVNNVGEVKDLGFLNDTKLTFKAQISALVASQTKNVLIV